MWANKKYGVECKENIINTYSEKTKVFFEYNTIWDKIIISEIYGETWICFWIKSCAMYVINTECKKINIK